MDDWQLIEDYAARGSEAAFRTLVARHLNLVRASALRQVNDAALADEVAQAVFILLARKARSLPHGIVLAGWLFRTTRFVAARSLRGEQRRQRREQEALEMQSLTAPDESWKRIAPVLDDALAQLPDADRNAVLLRFCEGRNHQEVGTALGLTEEAARKRVTRAIEKLRGFFAKRGFTLSAAGLASLLEANAAPAASAGLADSVAGTALAGGAAATVALPMIVKETLAAWRWAKVKLAASIAAGTACLVGVGILLATPKPVAPPVEPQNAGVTFSSAVEPSHTPKVSPAGKLATSTKPGERALRLHVVAKDNGEPVGNAQLAVNTVASGKWENRFDLATDQAGFANVPYPADAGRLDVGVLSWGWAARFATWRPNPEEPIPAEYILRLDRVTNTMGGWLRDARDRPVANAEILVSFHSNGDAAQRETPRERPGVMGKAVIARSDPKGWWTCAAIPPKDNGGFQFEARHPEFRTTTIADSDDRRQAEPAEAESLRLLWAGKLVTRMSAGPTLIGRVLDGADQPVSGARVVHNPQSDESLSATTDAGGYFTFSNLADDDFDFTVIAGGFAPEYRKVTLRQGVETVEVRLQPGALLRLRLVDEQGLPVPGATAGLEQWGELRHKLSWQAQSDADGRIEWNSAPPQVQLELYARRADWCYTRSVRLQADAEEHVIAMRRALVVTGRVTDADTGQPISEVKAFPGYGAGEFAWERLDTRRGANGNFTMQFAENKLPWRARVEAEGYLPFVSEPLSPDMSGWLDVALRREDASQAMRGVVLRPDGQPAAGAEVALLTLEHNVHLDGTRLRSDSGVRLIETTDCEGQFSFHPDPQAHSVVAASADGLARLRVRKPSEPVTLQLQPWGRIEGVIAANVRTRPIEAVVLEDPAFWNYKGRMTLGYRRATPDNEGRFAFDLVPPQTLCLSLNSGVGIPFHHATVVTVKSGETANVVVTGTGWRTRGRLVAPEGFSPDWEKQVVFANIGSAKPEIRPPAELDAAAAAFWLVDFWDSEAGRTLAATRHSVKLKVSPDGSFTSEDTVAAGDYRVSVATAVGNFNCRVTIAPPSEASSDVCDLGLVQLTN